MNIDENASIKELQALKRKIEKKNQQQKQEKKEKNYLYQHLKVSKKSK